MRPDHGALGGARESVGAWTFVSLNSRRESHNEEEEEWMRDPIMERWVGRVEASGKEKVHVAPRSPATPEYWRG